MKDWLKKHYVGLTASVIAVIALGAGVKNCSGNEKNGERIDGVEANVDSLINNQRKIIDVVDNHEGRIDENRQNIDRLRNRVGAVEDSVDVHRADIDNMKLRVDSVEMRVDSVEMRVDTIAKRQEKCPCVNPPKVKKAKKATYSSTQPVRRPARPNNVPVRRDTVVVMVKPEKVLPAQNANGCGDDQNANVVIRGNNNTVTVSNNGTGSCKARSDTTKTKTVTRTVTASCEATVIVNTRVSRNSYCR